MRVLGQRATKKRIPLVKQPLFSMKKQYRRWDVAAAEMHFHYEPTFLASKFVFHCALRLLCVFERGWGVGGSLYLYVKKDPRRYTALELPLRCCAGVFNPKIHTRVHFLNSSTTYNKGCPSLPPSLHHHHHQTPLDNRICLHQSSFIMTQAVLLRD